MTDAVARRADLVSSSGTNAYRILHGENDAMPGVVLDLYDTTAVLKLYTTAWLAHLEVVVGVIDEVIGPESLIVRFSRQVARDGTADLVEGEALIGAAPVEPVVFVENGLEFAADVVHGPKTGHFLDQRDNRVRVRSIASGARVLDVFCSTGGFSVNAAAGGAVSVHGIDVSPHAIDAAVTNMGRNAALPAVAACRHDATAGDAFTTMEKLLDRGERFDLVVVDPPSFASSRRQVDAALASYRRLSELAARLTAPSGRVMLSSCSSRVSDAEFFAAAHQGAGRAGADLVDVTHSAHGVDHPIGFAHGAYLSALLARVEPRR